MKNTIIHFWQYLLLAFSILITLIGLPAYADSNAISNIEFSTSNNGQEIVKINLKQSLATSPASFTVNDPPRIALDLLNTVNDTGKNTLTVNQNMLHTVNVVQAGDRTRVVLNLQRSAHYDTRMEGNALLIVLSDTATGAGAVTHFSTASATPVHHAIKNIDFRRGSGGEARIITTLADSSTGIDIRKQGGELQVNFINTDVPQLLQRRLDVTDFGTPVQTIATTGHGNDVAMAIKPKGEYDYSAYQTDNQFIVEVRQKTDTAAAAGAKPQYTGEKLSLNFQNTDVRSVLQVIADFTGKNIITSDTVTGNLTLLLKDVPWDQAFDIILRSKGLDKRENGNVIWVAPKDELLAKEKSDLEAQQSIESLEPLVVRQYQLNYKKADQAARSLLGIPQLPGDTGSDVTCDAQAQGIKAQAASAAAPMAVSAANNPNRILSARGTATSEMQTNTLIVNDTANKQDEVTQLLKLIDTPARQVMIEARVVVADDGFQQQLGTQLGASTPFTSNGSQGGISSTAQDAAVTSGMIINSASAGSTAVPRLANPFNVNLPSAAPNAATLGFSLFNIGSGALLNLELSAMEIDGRGKIISNPRVITANQKPAVILQGTQIPEVTPGTANSPPLITFTDAFLCLLVNPQILNNDSVILNIEVQDDAEGTPFSSGGVTAIPIDTKRIKTQVRVKNGETVVLGGIYYQNKRTDVNKVPFLGDIPILGFLFHDNSTLDQKTELMVFITPRIVQDDMTLQ